MSWQGENDYALFQSSFPMLDKQLWSAFYQLNQDKINVKNDKIAVEKLQNIILTTFKLASQHGFASMSLRELSQKTGISMGGLYNYIGSKHQLAQMINEFLPYAFFTCLEPFNQQSSSNIDKLLTLVRTHLFVSQSMKDWFFFAFMEAKHVDKDVRAIVKSNESETEQMLFATLNQANQSGEISLDEHEIVLMAMMIKGLLQNWYIKHYRYRQAKISCEQYSEFVEKSIKKQLGLELDEESNREKNLTGTV
ncbi:MAG: TetR/AcrR family transcriptional regulator [Gammaproteobacteria bacterium]|nr:TetR/AcrR family transcriptional regulator [Gammaproteobacteria bacterium]MDH5630240.1 TetR/AcrR family transcriptional regulator [Gammaproteobacteria bacterium]